MLTIFPEFKLLSLEDETKVKKITDQFPPYSDFNFVSLYSWGFDGSTFLSMLNDNLVIKFRDYISRQTSFSFIGKSDVDHTAWALINFAKKEQIEPTLHLIPESVKNLINNPSQFVIKDDRDAYDYIVSAKDLSALSGSGYAGKRHGVNKFKNKYDDVLRIKNLEIGNEVAQEIIQTFDRWMKTSKNNAEEIDNELKAMVRLLEHAKYFNLDVIGVYVHNKMVAFSIYEVLGHYAMGHFEKALTGYPGLYDFLKHITAVNLNKKGVQYINYEQDLGIEGLRKTKMLLRPEKFLKKYTVSLK